MEDKIKLRTLQEAKLIIESNYTLRELEKKLNIGKSTIHKDMHIRLKIIDSQLYDKVQKVFHEHINVRHLKGGESTKKKYQNMKKVK